MTPAECKAEIAKEYERMKRAGVRNPDTIIISLCRDAARHNGVPEYWREYMPKGAEE